MGRRAEPRRRRHRGGRDRCRRSAATTAAATRRSSSSGNPIDPLYLMMQLPGETRSGVRARATVRAASARRTSSRRSSSRGNDGGNYGKLIALPGARSVERAVTRARRVAHRGRPEDQHEVLAARPARLEGRARRRAAHTDRTTRSSTCDRSTSRARARSRSRASTTSRSPTASSAVLDTSVTDAVDNLLAGTTPAGRDAEHVGATPNPHGLDHHHDHDATTDHDAHPNTQPPPNATVAQLLARGERSSSTQANAGAREPGPRDLRRGHQAGRRRSSPRRPALVGQSSPDARRPRPRPASTHVHRPRPRRRPDRAGATTTSVAHA